MRVRSRWGAFALVGLSLLLVAWAGGHTAGQPPAVPAPARWEYKTVAHGGPGRPTDESLTKLGEEGWELVSVAAPPGRQELLYVFKRPKQK